MAARSAVAMRLSALVGAGFSAAAAVDYYGHSHTFCAQGSGCDAVRHSTLGETLGSGLPAVGMLGFAAIVVLSLARGEGLRLLAGVAALTGAVAGVALLALQGLLIGAYCALCVVVDVAAVCAGTAALPQLRRRPGSADQQAGRIERALTHAALVLALGAPIAWALSVPPAVPAYVRSLWQPGRVNVVEFSDFECPYCRGLHPALARALEAHGARVHFVRKSFPLPGHRHARDATRAYLCATEQGRGEPMADALFTAGKLDPASNRAHAARLGADLDAFDRCVASPATDARIDADMDAIRGADFHGLPTVWIGSQVFVGFDADAGGAPYARALDRAARGGGAALAWKPWALLAALLIAALLLTLRRRDQAS